MSLEVTGKIKFINAEQVSLAAFKRELVVTTEEQYPQHIMMEFTQDKCDLLNIYKVGEDVKVSINLRGREWVSPQGDTKYLILFKRGESKKCSWTILLLQHLKVP
jgi:hypothetical protein